MTKYNQILREYNGFVKTPNLFKSDKDVNLKLFSTSLPVEVSDVEALSKSVANQRFLGKRAEVYLLHYLQNSKRYTNIIYSLPIRDLQRTIGEIDFLCYDILHKNWIHIELIFKFYLFKGDKDYEDYSQWVGPNHKDRLDYKLNKLKTQQIPLVNHKMVKKTINCNQVDSYCCFKAKLFINKNLAPSTINKACVVGSYISLHTFIQLQKANHLFYIPSKRSWICMAKENQVWYTHQQALDFLTSSLKEKKATLLWQKTFENKVSEYFVVW